MIVSAGSSIITVDPETGRVGETLTAGFVAERIAISADGSALYATVDRTGLIRRYQLPDMSIEYEIDMGRSLFGRNVVARSMAVSPSDPSDASALRPNWFLEPDADGSAQGRIDSAGRFDANTVPRAQDWSIVQARLESGLFATALIRLRSADGQIVRVVPEDPVLAVGESVHLAVEGPNGRIEDISWRVTEGSDALVTFSYWEPFTAPARSRRSRLVATALAPNGRAIASTAIYVIPPRVNLPPIPRTAHHGNLLTLPDVPFNGFNNAVWFTSVSGPRVRALLTRDGVRVPKGAASGPAQLELLSQDTRPETTTLSMPFHVTVLPRVRVRAERRRVASGETVKLTATTPDGPGPWRVSWRAELGSVDDSGLFTAPVVHSSTFVRVWACLAGDTECGTTIVNVVAVRLEPDPLIVNPGEKVTLRARIGNGPVPAFWTAKTRNVTVTPDGELTAGNGPLDGGVAILDVITRDGVGYVDLMVGGPGIVASGGEHVEYIYPRGSGPGGGFLGTHGFSVAVRGDWLYVSSSNFASSFGNGGWFHNWIDVFRLDSRLNPVWVDSVEAPYGLPRLAVDGNDLFALGWDDDRRTSLYTRYDIETGRPLLAERRDFSGDPREYRRRGLSTEINPAESNGQNPGPITLAVTDHDRSRMRRVPLRYRPLSDRFRAAANGTDRWAAAIFEYSFPINAQELVVFDISGAEGEPLGIFPVNPRGTGYGPPPIVVLGDLLVAGADVYRVAGSDVRKMAALPFHRVIDTDLERRRVLGLDQDSGPGVGLRVADLSDPATPRFSAPVAAPRYQGSAALGPDYIAIAGGPETVSIAPIVWVLAIM